MKKRLVLILSVLFSFRCHNVRESKNERPYALTVTSSEILANLQKRATPMEGMIYGGNVRIKEGNEIDKPVEFEFYSARPGFVWARGPYATGNQPLIFWTMDGKTFQYQDVFNTPHVWYQGEATPCNLGQLLPDYQLSLYPNQLVEMLLGEAPLLQGITKNTITWDGSYGKNGAELLMLSNDQGQMEKIWLSKPIDGDVLKVEWYENAKEPPVWRIENDEFEAFDDEQKFRFPQKTTFTNVLKNKTVQLKWLEHSVDQKPSTTWREKFTLNPLTDGTKPKELVCH